MKGNPKVIKALNLSLKGELTAINQYFLHARMLENWGVTKLAAHEKKESIEEMHHADRLIQRILLLEGLPNLQDLGKLMIGQDVKETIECDMKLEIEGIKQYRENIKLCEEVGDYVTRDLFLSNTVRMHRKLRNAGIHAELHIKEAAPHAGLGGGPEDQEIDIEARGFADARWAGR